MEVRDNSKGKGLYSTKKYSKGEIVHILSGTELDHPTRESIHIGNNRHLIDHYGKFINHSFTPTIQVVGVNLVALRDIETDEEITFNYNISETQMANPFYVDGILVCGQHL
jgi:hypothetical protein